MNLIKFFKMQLTNGTGCSSHLKHVKANASNVGLIKKRERKNSTVSSCTCPPQRYATNRTPRESTCAEDDDDEEEQRACHRVTNIECTRGGPDSTVSRWRSRGSGDRGQVAGGTKAGDGWMGELWVIRDGQARAALLPLAKGVRAAREAGRRGGGATEAW